MARILYIDTVSFQPCPASPPPRPPASAAGSIVQPVDPDYDRHYVLDAAGQPAMYRTVVRGSGSAKYFESLTWEDAEALHARVLARPYGRSERFKR